MDDRVRRLVGAGAILAPLLHTFTDVVEAVQGGFSVAQLWLNYAAFVPVPALVVGLWWAQRPRSGWLGLAGALGYGWAFVYFAHTTLLALEQRAPDYAALWEGLGRTYTAHGALMIAAGAAFALDAWRARVVPRWASAALLAGLGTNLVLALFTLPPVLQVVGSAARNLGLAGMGLALLRGTHGPDRHAPAT